MKEEKIQTLHPTPGKTNKKITLKKYEFIKTHLLSIISKLNPTHTELMEELSSRTNGNFDGNAQWYGETVKLDLEARDVIERTTDKPQKYRLKVKK